MSISLQAQESIKQGVTQVLTLSGKVFLDKNQNGSWDLGEKVMRGIAVSNGVEVLFTDRKGNYKISVRPGQSVFPIIPSGFKLTHENDRLLNKNFYYVHPDSLHQHVQSIDFPLQKQRSSSDFSFGAIGDIQVGDSIEVNYAAKGLFSELSQLSDIQFNLVLGDLINDDVAVFEPVRQLLSSLQTPAWTLPGNHDRNVKDLNRMEEDFNRIFGASTYAFYAGNALFLTFNNVQATVKYGYEGRYRTDQLEFLKAVLRRADKNQLLVISQHIPMGMTRNREEVFELLTGFKHVLILAAHTHQVSRHFYENGSNTIHELVAGAPSGTWWTGEKSIQGIPFALMQCGSPQNYFTIDVRGNHYSINFKGIGLDAKKQMDISLKDGQIVANVFAGSSKTKVHLQINDSDWVEMQSQQLTAPNVSALLAKYKSKIYPTDGNRVLPLRDRASPHIWTHTIPNGPKTLIKIKIKAEDSYGLRVEQEQWFSYFE